jgi:hypothetical protein
MMANGKQSAKQTVSTLPSGDESLPSPPKTFHPEESSPPSASSRGTIPHLVAEQSVPFAEPFPGTVAHPSANPSRKPRCRMNDRHRNPCPNPSLNEFGVCLRHMRETADEWKRVKDEATAMFPTLRRILDEDGDADR